MWSRSWTADTTSLLDEVYSFLRDARWRARSRSWMAAATTLLDEVYAILRAARWRVRGAGLGRLMLLPYWMRSTTQPPILPPTSGLARKRQRRGARRYLQSASLHLSPLTSVLARKRGRRGAQLDGEFALYASRRRFGGGGGGVRRWTGSCDVTRFFPRIDRIFPGESLNPFFGAQDEGFSEFRSR